MESIMRNRSIHQSNQLSSDYPLYEIITRICFSLFGNDELKQREKTYVSIRRINKIDQDSSLLAIRHSSPSSSSAKVTSRMTALIVLPPLISIPKFLPVTEFEYTHNLEYTRFDRLHRFDTFLFFVRGRRMECNNSADIRRVTREIFYNPIRTEDLDEISSDSRGSRITLRLLRTYEKVREKERKRSVIE